MSSGEKYLAAAYVIVLAAVLTYLVIISAKLSRLEREVGELVDMTRGRRD